VEKTNGAVFEVVSRQRRRCEIQKVSKDSMYVVDSIRKLIDWNSTFLISDISKGFLVPSRQ